MPSAWQDARYAWRAWRRTPVAALVVVGTLALVIGVNSTVFSFVNAFLLRPPAVGDPERLVGLFARRLDKAGFESASFADYRELRDAGQAFKDVFAYGIVSANLGVEQRSRTVLGEAVTANYFAALGVALEGRGFLPEEDAQPGAHPVVVISRGLWQRELGAARGSVGRSIRLNGRAFDVVGIAPEGFRGTMTGISADFWLPLGMQATVRPGANLEDRADRWLELGGVLNPGVSVEQAQAAVDALAQRLEREHPETHKKRRIAVRSSLVRPEIGTALSVASAILLGVVALILVIGCVNVATLFLARASERVRDVAVRLALGIPRGRLVRQMLTESTLLAVLGGALGLLLASVLAGVIARVQPPIPMSVTLDVGLDWRVISYTLGLSLLTGLLFGLTPALQATRSALVSALRGDAAQGLSRGRLTRWLVTGEIVATLVLLFVAVLFLRSLSGAQAIDPGFETRNGLVVSLPALNTAGYAQAEGEELYRQLDQRLRRVPGVTQVALASVVPLGLVSDTIEIEPEGWTPEPGVDAPRVDFAVVTPDFFATLGLKTLRGRSFDARDVAGAPRVAMVNEAFARRFSRQADPIGRRVMLIESGASAAVEIVGVVPTGKYRSLGEEPRPYLYVPLAQRYQSSLFALLRVQSDPASAGSSVRREIAALAPMLPPVDVATLSAHVSRSLWPAQMAAQSLGGLGVMALLLAVAGLYAVMSHFVNRRVREVGVRMALGAQPGDVLRLVVGEALKLTGRGIAIGLLIAFLVARLLTGLLYGVGSLDPVAVFGVPALVTSVAALAAYIPARRAMCVDPAVALRQQE